MIRPGFARMQVRGIIRRPQGAKHAVQPVTLCRRSQKPLSVHLTAPAKSARRLRGDHAPAPLRLPLRERGAHVSEVQPSLWRLLRALYSVWRLRNPDLDTELVHGLLARLAVPPTYALPPYRIAHTRHYYPDSKHRTGAPSTNKAVDAFAVLDGDRTIYVIWSCDLDPEQDDALPRLAREARRTAETRSRAIPLRQRAATTVRPPSAPHAGRAQCRGFS